MTLINQANYKERRNFKSQQNWQEDQDQLDFGLIWNLNFSLIWNFPIARAEIFQLVKQKEKDLHYA